MLSKTAQLVILAALGLYALGLILLLRRQRLNLKYTLLWILSGLLMLVLGLFPGILPSLARLVGIASEINALFAAVLFCLIMILMSLTAIVSGLNDRVKRLTQVNALLEKRLRELEEADRK